MIALQEHPYLATELIGLPAVLLAFLACRPLRRELLIAGIVLVPFAPLALLHQPEFWSPDRLGGRSWGVEDALYLFQTGVVSWLCARLSRSGVASLAVTACAMGRASAITATALAGLACAVAANLPAFETTLAALAMASLALLVHRPAGFGAALAGSFGYTLYHYANVRLGIAMWPDFLLTWNSEFWSHLVLGVPRGEIVFALAIGAAHPLMLSFVFGVESSPTPTGREPEGQS